MRNHGTARAPGRASVPERAWHEAAWRARDAARMARFQWEQASRWEVAGALWLVIGGFFLALSLVIPMPGPQHSFCATWFSLLCAGGAAAFALARLRRKWHGRGTKRRRGW